MLDIIAENEGIEEEGEEIGENGHIVDADIFEFNDGQEEEGTRKKRNALRDRESLWPGGAIPYVIDGYYNINHKKQILAGMQRFHEKTCIRFVPRTIERDYIFFTQNLGCWSMVGRTGGRQKISLSGTCRGSRGVIMHELMHAIGFRHEHNRPDRDGYIDVYWQNIKEGFTTNFRKYSNDQVQTLGTGYDFLSLMHYPLTAFSKDGNSVTIGPRYPTYQIGDVGNQNDFSHIDIYRINLLYKCGQCEDSDKYYCPIWAMMGECSANKEWMTKYCPFSCDRCTIALRKGDGLACIDTTSNCKRWSKIGECERNPAYMLQNCRRSCKQCRAVDTETGQEDGLACQDDNTLCYDWATLGECSSNAKFMKKHCRRSCRVCTGGDGRIIIDTDSDECQDTTMDCALWAAQNMCKDRQKWMAERCRRTCLWCSHRIVTIPDQADESRVTAEGGVATNETSRAGDEDNRVGDEIGVLGDETGRVGDETSRVGGEETREGKMKWEPVKERILETECEDSDKYYCPIWAMMGECSANKEWMTKYCPFSCDRCTIALRKGDGLACIDTTSNCKRWSKIGECERNPAYMLQNCRRSCKQCRAVDTETGQEDGLACQDDNTLCYDWATLGECSSNAKFMKKHCRRSCRVCTGGDGRIIIDTDSDECQDTTMDCALWAAQNMCKDRQKWMAERCRRTCLWCSHRIVTIPDQADESRVTAEGGVATNETSRAGDEDNRVGDEIGVLGDETGRMGDETSRVGGEETRGRKDEMGASEGEDFGDRINDERNSDADEGSKVGGNTRIGSQSHAEGELYGGSVNSTGWSKPQGCVDEHDTCSSWASDGDCMTNPEWMAIKCPVSCGLCGDNGIVPACVDRHRNCSYWTMIGECDEYPEWMVAKCPQSCGLCGSQPTAEQIEGCEDNHVFCKHWAKTGNCDSGHVWMRVHCKKSCDFCSLPIIKPPCMDAQQRCRELALKGECRSNRGWMAYQCPLSCGTCKKQDRFEECRDRSRRCQQYAADGQCHSRQRFMNDVCPYSCGFCRVGNTLRSGRYRSFDPALLDAGNSQSEQNGAVTGDELLPASKRRPSQSLRSRLRLSSINVNRKSNVNSNNNSVDNRNFNRKGGRFLTSSGQNQTRECRDRNPQCPTWAKTTRCLVNQGYMQENCQLSCKWCPKEETCVDIDPGCEKWARGGHCLTNEEGLRDKCQKSCGHCGEVEECRDVHRKCREWRKEGWCNRSPLFMRKFCAPSCGLCDDNRPGNHNVTVVQPAATTAPVKAKKTTKQIKQAKLAKQKKLEQQQQEREEQRAEQQLVERQRQEDRYVALGLDEVQRLILNTDGNLTIKEIKSLKRARKTLKQRQQQEKEFRAIQKAAKRNNLNRETEPIMEGLDEAAVRQ
nr:uncharacterized protein LOC129282127 [Lytechinus pictus]